MSDLILAKMAEMTKAEPPTQRVHKNKKKLENPNTTLRRKRRKNQMETVPKPDPNNKKLMYM